MQHRILAFALLVAACGGKTVSEIPTSSSPSPTGTASSTAPAPAATFDDTGGAVPPPTPEDCPTFTADVMPVLERGGCTIAQCHGGPNPPNLPFVDPAAPKATYAGFAGFRTSDGRRYLDVDQPWTSSIACNLHGTCGVRMPIGSSLADADLATVDHWLACGAPR